MEHTATWYTRSTKHWSIQMQMQETLSNKNRLNYHPYSIFFAYLLTKDQRNSIYIYIYSKMIKMEV